ncbi:MAG: phosphopyruvate hydratase, partial [Planctomycetaceae bacterium]|nr:phosphopyruvate hydratase [Planctomycetaceae bacterium]
MTTITHLTAREVFDSRGRPTVEAEVACVGGRSCRAIAPSGASTGTAEACELRDGGTRLGGKGVRRAVGHVREEIAAALIGMDASQQTALDERLIALDGTPNKSRLGANAILAVSLASVYAAADALGRTPSEHFHHVWQHEHGGMNSTPALPLPMVNMISGGKHAGGQLDFQDFLLMPVGAKTYSEGLDWIVTVYHELGRVLNAAGFEGTLVGDEGGYGPRLPSNDAALDLIMRAIEQAGYQPERDLAFALDVASTHFYHDGAYHLAATGGQRLSSTEMIDRLEDWVNRYPIISIEDALAEEDWEGWQRLTA